MIKKIILASMLTMYVSSVDIQGYQISSKNEPIGISKTSSFSSNNLSNYSLEQLSNPFILAKGNNWSIDDEIIVNKKAISLIEKTIPFALGMQNLEDSIMKNNVILRKLLLEELMERDTKILKKHDKIRERFNIPKNESLYVLGKEKLSFNDDNYSAEINNFLKNLNYYGSGFNFEFTAQKQNIKFKDLFAKNEMHATDCITYIQNCLTLATNENFNGKKYNDATKIGKKLRKEGYETIFVAQNSISRDEKYEYSIGKDTTNLVADRIKRVKRNKYYLPVDYIVTDSNFTNPAFEDFLNSANGFVFMQEGNHVGFLINGNFCHAIQKANPLYTDVFRKENLYGVMDNDNPKKDYQSALILLPKGSVEKYLNDNKIELNKLK